MTAGQKEETAGWKLRENEYGGIKTHYTEMTYADCTNCSRSVPHEVEMSGDGRKKVWLYPVCPYCGRRIVNAKAETVEEKEALEGAQENDNDIR